MHHKNNQQRISMVTWIDFKNIRQNEERKKENEVDSTIPCIYLKIHVPNNFICFTGTHANQRIYIGHIRMIVKGYIIV